MGGETFGDEQLFEYIKAGLTILMFVRKNREWLLNKKTRLVKRVLRTVK